MKKIFEVALIILFVTIILVVYVEKEDSSLNKDSKTQTNNTITKDPPDRPSTHNYHVANTVSFRGGDGNYWAQTKGVLFVNKVAEKPVETSYTYGFVADVNPTDKLGAEITFPAVHVLRDKTTDRFIGGDLLMGNLGLAVNATLNQVKERMVPDGMERHYPFEFKLSADFPSQIIYRVVGRSVTRKTGERVILALAISEPFTYNSPEGNEQISAEHRVLSVLDEKMEQVYFQADRYAAINKTETEEGVFSVESEMVRMENGNPLNLSDMEEELKMYYWQLGLSEDTPPESSNTGLPIWAMHSLAIRDLAGITAGSAIEGKPNFVITATIGMVLLADSAVSVGTSLLKESGAIDWQWKGIPNYIGQGVGLMSATGIEAATGQTLDKQRWKDLGGLAGTAASLFIPSSVLGSGVQLGSGGVNVLQGVDLAGKNLRLSSEGLEIIRGGKGWIDSARTYEQLKSLQTMLKVGNIAIQTKALSEKYIPETKRIPIKSLQTMADELTRQKELDAEREQLAEERRKIEAERQQLAMAKRPSQPATGEIAQDGRFIAYDNGTVLDTKTKLMWAAKDNGSHINWANAKSYCENYRGAGYTDWRMPTQDELAGLYDSNKSYKVTTLSDYSVHLTELIQLTGCCPWASETRGSDAAAFDFTYGRRGWGRRSTVGSDRALPVRSGK